VTSKLLYAAAPDPTLIGASYSGSNGIPSRKPPLDACASFLRIAHIRIGALPPAGWADC